MATLQIQNAPHSDFLTLSTIRMKPVALKLFPFFIGSISLLSYKKIIAKFRILLSNRLKDTFRMPFSTFWIQFELKVKFDLNKLKGGNIKLIKCKTTVKICIIKLLIL